MEEEVHMRVKRLLTWILTVAVCLSLCPAFGQAEENGRLDWQIVRTVQEDDRLDVWYVTNQPVRQMLSFTYGNVELEQIGQPDNTSGIGYIFVLDTTQSYDSVKLDTLEVANYALKYLAANDAAAFVSVNSDVTVTDFIPVADLTEVPEDVIARRASRRPKRAARIWDGISRAVDLAVQDPQMKHHVIIVVTDGQERDSAATSDQVLGRIQSEKIPVHVLLLSHYDLESDASRELLALGELATPGGSGEVTSDNYKMTTDTAVAYSGRLYMSRLALGASVRETAGDRISIAFQGGKILAVSDPINIYMNAVPTFTPAPETVSYEAYIGPATADDDLIRTLNSRLYELGYLTDPEIAGSAVYTDKTESAVRTFYSYQKREDLPAGGGITADAYYVLLSPSAVSLATPSPVPEITAAPTQELILTPTPAPTIEAEVSPTPDPKMAFSFDQLGSEEALSARDRLIALGYMSPEASQDALNFAVAVRSFCLNNGLPYEEGRLSKEALALLMSEEAEPSEGTRRNLKAGQEASEASRAYIAEIQKKLEELGYFAEASEAYTSGELDETTVRAVRAFAEASGLELPEGDLVLSPEAQLQILGSSVRNPETSTVNQAKKLLDRTWKVMDYEIPGWILAAVIGGVVLLILILILIRVAINRKKKKRQENGMEVAMDGETEDVEAGALRNETAEDGDTEFVPLPGDSGSMMIASDEETNASGTGREINLLLSVLEPSGKNWERPVFIQEGQEKTIGRQGEIMLSADDRNVSRIHGILSFDGEQLYFEDQSTHGTTVDGREISGEKTELHDGTEMRIGHSIVRIRYN